MPEASLKKILEIYFDSLTSEQKSRESGNRRVSKRSHVSDNASRKPRLAV
jgi:hypothetical protein